MSLNLSKWTHSQIRQLKSAWKRCGILLSNTSPGLDPMSVNLDFRDLFAALNVADAEFLIVGGYALAVHGAPRFTKDLDVWVDANPDNAQKVWNALDAFGAPFGDLTIQDLSVPGIVFQMGLPPNRIDIITVIDGVEFHEAWEHRVPSAYGDQPVMVIGIDDLIRNKEATGRPQDSIDAMVLRKSRS
jgi:hypothetical protein